MLKTEANPEVSYYEMVIHRIDNFQGLAILLFKLPITYYISEDPGNELGRTLFHSESEAH